MIGSVIKNLGILLVIGVINNIYNMHGIIIGFNSLVIIYIKNELV